MSAAKKAVGPARELRVEIDNKNGDIRAFAKLIVSEKVISKHDQISVFDSRRIKPDSQVGDELEIEVTPAGFGRIASQYAKQALMQKIRQAEKSLIFTEFKDRVGDIVSGTVRRFDRSDVILDLGKYEALLPNKERVPTEEYQVGERIRCYVKAVEQGSHGPEIILSRADPRFIIKLFQVEVSEINDGTIEIKGIAREPGFRTKMAVYSRDSKVDPVGACVGMRGQNARLTARLTGWEVDIDAEHIVTKGFEEKVAEAVAMLARIPGITKEQADALVHAGIIRLEDLLSAEASDIAEIPQIGENAGTILEAARTEVARRTLTVKN